MNAELKRYVEPREYFLERFESTQKRSDGRGFRQARNAALTSGVCAADGSSMVRIGNTTVFVGGKLEVAVPHRSEPNSGFLVINVDFPPVCDPDTLPGRPSRKAQEMTSLVNDLFKTNHVLSTGDLVIVPGKAVWVLYIDAVVLNDDGSVEDAIFLACSLVLRDVQLPNVVFNEEEGSIRVQNSVSVGDVFAAQSLSVERAALDLSRSLFCVSIGIFDGTLLVDPSLEEESVCDSKVVLCLSETGELCGMRKFGGVPLTGEQLEECTKEARSRVEYLISRMESKMSK